MSKADEYGLRRVTYVDADGRSWLRLIPERAPDSDAAIGIPYGPPALYGLGLPLATEVRLHNELYARELFTVDDLIRRRQDVHAALMAALAVDANRIIDLVRSTAAGAAANGTSGTDRLRAPVRERGSAHGR